jgi:hypothetical protein
MASPFWHDLGGRSLVALHAAGRAALRGVSAFLRALGRASIAKPIEFSALVVAAASVGLLVWQLWALNDTLESQAYNYIDSGLIELDKIFIENSAYRPYFRQNRPVPAEEKERQKVWALTDAHLDFMDNFFSQENHIDWKRYTKPGWLAYFKDSFSCSAALRESFCMHENEYGESLRNFAKTSFPPGLCDNGKPRPLQPQPACDE